MDLLTISCASSSERQDHAEASEALESARAAIVAKNFIVSVVSEVQLLGVRRGEQVRKARH
jgi:hypothetical protein